MYQEPTWVIYVMMGILFVFAVVVDTAERNNIRRKELKERKERYYD